MLADYMVELIENIKNSTPNKVNVLYKYFDNQVIKNCFANF